MCDNCNQYTLVWAHPTDGHICEDCFTNLYCYRCFTHQNICGFRYNYHGTYHCLNCINILYETDDEYNEFLEEVRRINLINI